MPQASEIADVAVAFESQSGELLVTYAENARNQVRYRTWSTGTGWSGELSGPDLGAVPNAMTLSSDPTSNTIMLAVQDNTNDLNYVAWLGSGWGSPELETNSGETATQPFVFLWDHFVNVAPVITSNGGGSTALINVAENTSTVTSVTASDINLPAIVDLHDYRRFRCRQIHDQQLDR